MRHFFQGLLVAAIGLLMTTVAMAGNQETAELIAKNLRDSGKLGDARIAVKFQDGTVWLTGRVRNDEQMSSLLKTAFSTPGVDRVVNNMSVGTEEAPADAKWLGRPAARTELSTQTTVNIQPAAGALEPDRVSRPLPERMSMPRPHVAARAVENRSAMEDHAIQPVGAIEPQLPAPPQALPQFGPQLSPVEPAVSQNARRGGNVQGRPIPIAYRQPTPAGPAEMGSPQPMHTAPMAAGPAPYRYDQPTVPNYAWPSYAAHPNYAAVTYPRQYSPSAWPYIGPFYPYPQVPLGWRKVTLEWDDGWWWLDFKNVPSSHRSPVGRKY